MRPITSVLIPLLCALPASAVPSASINTPPPWPWRRLLDKALRTFSPVSEVSVLDDALLKQSPITEDGVTGQLRARYGQDIVLRFNISSAQEALALQDASNVLFLDIWEFTENWVDIRLAKNMVQSLLGLLPQSLQHSHTPLLHDSSLVEAIAETLPYSKPLITDHQRSGFTPRLSKTQSEHSIFFNDYQPLSVILPWMKLLASYYPTHVRLLDVGTTHEGREIPAMRLGVRPTNNEQASEPRKTIVITGGSHAREWVSTSTVNFVAFSLLTAYGKSPIVTSMLELFDWVFVPTLNPDGYVYTWETDRLWRKNRQPTSLPFCSGADLDRSYGFHWDGEDMKANPCSESFAGEGPFEAIEAKSFAAWARNETENNNVQLIGLLDLHSYSQQVLYPYSFSCKNDPPSLEDLQELALGLAKAMRLSPGGHYYKATSACEGNVAVTEGRGEKTNLPRLEAGGGSLLDWFYHELKARYAFQIKLRDTGNYGFLLPKEYIVPTGREVLEAVLYLGRFLNGSVGLAEEEEEAEEQSNTQKPERTSAPSTVVAGEKDTLDKAPVSNRVAQEIQELKELFELRRRRR